ncbi:MAG: type II toxin-antitoxin system Phd/YefM family antitoxin [Mesorhizobium sp.]|uniref:type II toxin-antitoxin system Phd/YefM family antitoxin n=1 Tax=Mesorhizobium sp. TaxID=1871066 RepID=UPI000FD27E10|nr:type II toxin-antitoxin system Phd/YefM family antitoxin [Mesorhizobium sp.]RVC63578.1 type II toxin-antitoxin system Phd/YefM family antitoxin [Mesorhizobium sp. M4B.F.Ca.ET.088.02.2.1]RWF33069.1 MAG: type II toxin-antitoxin system Phd/YefM family antitoxin [Mesorhizobium sp.]RWF37798.1 MAG: type II toxin-antitoxin system Phd/YefM family antitoxin [Mesorhizobium sp.]TIX15335.1 MAG: type II toxin-antitoxin system Phd/YefM family antitoxin [Mesorhizobium sp.]TIX41198.1 MAG: type II toxin-ant
MRVTSTEFQQNVGRFQDAAQHAPVAITKNGRTHTVLLSATMFEILLKGRVARPIEELDDETLEAIAKSAVPSQYDELDAVLKDWTP